MRQRFADLDEWAEADSWDADDWRGPGAAHVMREVLAEEYAGAADEDYDDALESVLDGMSAAEAFSVAKALRQIQSGAGQALANPLVGQVARTALPVGAGALGTLVGGPAGTAIGSRLGTLAAGALARPAVPAVPGRPGGPGVTPTLQGVPPAAGGSAAAAQGLVLSQQPDILKALLALSMGQHGAREIGGVPVASVMNLLSSVFGQAAADADELAYANGEGLEDESLAGSENAYAASDLGAGRSLYTTLMDAENEELTW